MPALKPGVSSSGSTGVGSPSRMLIQALPDREGQALVVMLIGAVIGVRWLGPGTYHNGFRSHSRGGQERLEIGLIIEPAVEIEMVYVFLRRDLPDIRVRGLAVIHRPHVGHDNPARPYYPVELLKRVFYIGQVAEQIPAEDSVHGIVEQTRIECIHPDEYGLRGNALAGRHPFGYGHRGSRGIPAQQDRRAIRKRSEVAPVTAWQVNYHPRGVFLEQLGSPYRVGDRRVAPEVLFVFQVGRTVSLVPQRNGISITRRIAVTQRSSLRSPRSQPP